jgi:predicted nucleic acid-binding protein
VKVTICDTGPLLAYLNRSDPFHAWAVEQMRLFRPPLLTCDAVMTEAMYFLREDKLDPAALFAMLERGALRLDFDLTATWPRLRTLMARYKQMDLADACVVAMTERWPQCVVLTLDRRDFSVYRRNDRQLIDFIAPP